MDVKVEVTRVVDGREIPPPGTWVIDPSHSEVEFMVRHMMISKVRGRFRQFDGTIVISERPEDSRVEVFIEAARASTPATRRGTSICARPTSSTSSTIPRSSSRAPRSVQGTSAIGT
jgi:YceI-like domain